MNSLNFISQNTNLYYTYTVYLADPAMQFYLNTSAAEIKWDYAISITAKTPEEAMENLPEAFKNWNVVKIDNLCINL
jgi:hypothetical protein